MSSDLMYGQRLSWKSALSDGAVAAGKEHCYDLCMVVYGNLQ